MGSAKDKNAQFASNMVEPNKDTRLTTDFGTKQNTTEDWLRVNNGDQIGPGLIEDGFAREKVLVNDSRLLLFHLKCHHRSIASITNASPNARSTPGELEHLEPSSSTNPPRTSPMLVFSPTPLVKHPSSYDSQLCLEAEAPQTRFVMSVALPSSSTRRRETGTLWAITSLFSSSKMPSNFQTSSTRANRNRTTRSHRRRRPITISGTLFSCTQKQRIWPCGQHQTEQSHARTA